MAGWWSGASIQCCLLLLLLPTVLLAQDDCSHNCKNETNRYYYVRPEGSAETLCPAQPCLTPSQLSEHFSECERNNSCPTANSSLVLLPGTYTLESNHGSLIPQLKFLSLTGYNDEYTDSLATPSIDCYGNWISMMFQRIESLHVRNCIVFTGYDTTEVDHVTFHDSLIRLASTTAADHSELDYNYTLGSQSYCRLQKQLGLISTLAPSNSALALKNVSFSSDHHTTCAREYGIQLATIHASDSVLDIEDCLFTQNAVTHISLLHSTLCTSGKVQFRNANTAILTNNNSTIGLAGVVDFFNNDMSAIQVLDSHSTILLAGTVEFTNNTADYGGAVLMAGGNLTIADNAEVLFQGNHADFYGGAIASSQHVTIAGSVQFINNSADNGGAIYCDGDVTTANNAHVLFEGNHANTFGGAITSHQHVNIAGPVEFINNSADQGGAIDSGGSVTITDNAQVFFQSNYAKTYGGTIACSHVTIAGSVQFNNNSAYQGSAINSDGNVTITDNAQTVFHDNHAKHIGGAIFSFQHVTIAGSAQFINNSAKQGGAIDSDGNVTIGDNAYSIFQGNDAKTFGGAIESRQHVTISGSVRFINNSANQGGAIDSEGSVTIIDKAQIFFQGNHAKTIGGAVNSPQHVTIAGSVQFINNTANQGGAINSDANVTIAENAQLRFQGNHAKHIGGAIFSIHHVTIAGSVQFINNSACDGGAINSNGNVTIADNAQLVFHDNHAKHIGGAIFSIEHVTIAGSVQFINNSACDGGAIDNATRAENAHAVFQSNNTKTYGGAIASGRHATIAGSVQFINNSADQGGAIDSDGSVTIAKNALAVFQGNHAKAIGGAIVYRQHATFAGSVQFVNNSADQGGAIGSGGNVTIVANSQMYFQGNHAKINGGAIDSAQHVTIAGSVQFINNSADQGGAIDSKGCITIDNNAQMVFQGNHAKTNGGAVISRQHVTIAGSVQFINNTAYQGAGINSDGNVTIADNAQLLFQGNHAKHVGGAIFSVHQVTSTGSVQFINNSAYEGGAIDSAGSVTIAETSQLVIQGYYSKLHGSAVGSIQQITIPHTVEFINNSAYKGGAIASAYNVTIMGQVVFQGNYAKLLGGAIACSENIAIAGSVHFINNSASQGGAIISHDSVTTADNAQVIFEANHADSVGGAIVIDSILVLAGNVQFISNTAQLGGAIAMLPGNMTIVNNAEVVFQGNHAYHVGGAIYSSARSFVHYIVFSEPCLVSFGINSTVDLLHNTAEHGGSAMYGITMSKLECRLSRDGDYRYLFDVITVTPDSVSAVSSDPLRICICPDQSTPDCLAILPDQDIPHLHYTVYPGQNFTIPAAVVGFNFALTSGSVYAQFLSSDASLGSESQYVQGVNQTGCSPLQYSVLSDKKQETLVFTANGKQVGDIYSSVIEDIRAQNNNSLSLYKDLILANLKKYYANSTFVTHLIDGIFRLAGYVQLPLQTTPVYITVQLLDCPPGFTLTDQQSCDCDVRLLTNLLTCNINNQTVHRYGNIWINTTFSGNTSNGVIVHKHCPFEYCKPEQLDVNLTHPETQCAFDHYGTLCGACKPNFSLALGGSQCLPNCSNSYLSLLIPFALAGFAVVFFIKILNLTVSQGTINGLIFYANLVAANRSILFPARSGKLLSFLSVFISWLNLDLGIETCFIKGLDGYWKTWLQFVFPFYVWAIAGGIIVASHNSTHATKLFGDTSVSVLATLFLLSYAKLLRSIITIFSFTTLEYPDNTTAKVWSFDGNVQYLSSKHIPLFLFALAIVLLLWLPYTGCSPPICSVAEDTITS